MKLFLITVLLLGVSIAGIAIKIWGKKSGEFAGTCAGSNIKMREQGITCGCGGGTCLNEDENKHHHDHNHDHQHETKQVISIKKIS